MKKVLQLRGSGLTTVPKSSLCGSFLGVTTFALVLSLCLSLSMAGHATSGAVASSELATGGASGLISIDTFTNGGDFVGTGYATASVTALIKDASGHPINGAKVIWSIVSAVNYSPAMYSGWGTKKTGLTWGASPTMVKYDANPQLTATTTSNTEANGKTSIQLTDIVGERSITIQAKVTIDDTDYTVTQTVTYGNGPLSVFKAPDSTNRTWDQAYQLCNGSAYTGDHITDWSPGAYVGGAKMPTRAEVHAVSSGDSRFIFPNTKPATHGAAFAAGWPFNFYWTGETFFPGDAFYVGIYNGVGMGCDVSTGSTSWRVACRR